MAETRQRLLWELHAALLHRLHATLTGNEPITASLLSVARLFLLDNGIKARGQTNIRRGLDDLSALALPFKAPEETH